VLIGAKAKKGIREDTAVTVFFTTVVAFRNTKESAYCLL